MKMQTSNVEADKDNFQNHRDLWQLEFILNLRG